MRTLILLLSLKFLLLVETRTSISTLENRCYNPELDFYPFMGTRTAYSFVRGFIGRPEATCEPKQVWILARHGTRYPGEKSLRQLLDLPAVRDDIIRNHNNKRGKLCTKDLKNLETWIIDPELKFDNTETLTEQGKKDLLFLAKRLKSALPEILKTKDPEDVEEEDYVFRSTDTQRTKASLKAFGEGLFGKPGIVKPERIPENDTLLLLHKNCPAWGESYVEEHVTFERDKFVAGPEVLKLIEDVSLRLGYTEKLNYSQIKTMYEMCRYETAWYLKRDSPWCALFYKREMKIFEYVEDLDYYYCCGSGRDMSKKVGCQTLSNMFYHFKKIESGLSGNQPKGVFLFAHSITLQTFMSALGIGVEPTSFSAKSFSDSDDRNFRSSLLGPFATNFIAVFYKCINGPGSPNKVMFFVGERPVSLPGIDCSNGLCEWETVKKAYNSEVDKCSTDFCYNYRKQPKKTGTSLTKSGACGLQGLTHAILCLCLVAQVLEKLYAGC